LQASSEVEEETGLIVEPEQTTGLYQNVTRDTVALVFCFTLFQEIYAPRMRQLRLHRFSEIASAK